MSSVQAGPGRPGPVLGPGPARGYVPGPTRSWDAWGHCRTGVQGSARNRPALGVCALRQWRLRGFLVRGVLAPPTPSSPNEATALLCLMLLGVLFLRWGRAWGPYGTTCLEHTLGSSPLSFLQAVLWLHCWLEPSGVNESYAPGSSGLSHPAQRPPPDNALPNPSGDRNVIILPVKFSSSRPISQTKLPLFSYYLYYFLKILGNNLNKWYIVISILNYFSDYFHYFPLLFPCFFLYYSGI